MTCGHCYQCRTGQAHMCPESQIFGVDRDGAFAEYVAEPESVIWQNDQSKLPSEIATLQKPFGNAVFATLSHDLVGQSVGVFGCGPIGLFCIGIAKASGVAAVFAVDPVRHRLDLARQTGATDVFNLSGQDTGSWMRETNESYPVDIVLEMSDAAQAITSEFTAVRNLGRITLFSIPSDQVEVDIAQNIIFKNLTVFAINGRRIWDTWFKTRWLLESGVVDLRPLIKREVEFDDVCEAFGELERGEACKIILRPNEGIDPVEVNASRKVDQADLVTRVDRIRADKRIPVSHQ